MSHTFHPIIPESECCCVWMDAGLATYRLCDNHFQCDTCSFDAQIRMNQSAAGTNTGGGSAVGMRTDREYSVLTAQTAEEYCASTMKTMLHSITRVQCPDDRLYAANHTWAKKEEDGSYTIGVDHFIGAVLSGVQSVACSLPTTHISASAPCAWIIAGSETLAVRSPLSGTVIECNTALAGVSDAVHADPYAKGWIARIRPDAEQDAHSLIRKEEMARVVKKDADRLSRSINAELARLQTQLEGTMYDGGTVLENFEQILGAKKYYGIIERFLRP